VTSNPFLSGELLANQFTRDAQGSAGRVRDSAEIRSRKDALQTILSDRLDIFYPPNLP
jgi:hypothetical protein